MTQQVDLRALGEFAASLLSDARENYPHLLDPVHGERASLGDGDRLVPEALELRAEIRRRSREAGYYGGFMPTAVGGAGWSQQTCVAVYEALAARPAFPPALWLDLSVFVAGQAWGPVPALLEGSSSLQERFLAPLVAGTMTSCTAITDPIAGSDPHNMRANAVRTGTGYVINGTKKFVGNAAYADVTMFYARTSGEVGDRHGVSCFVVTDDNPGRTVDRIFPVMEGRGNHGQIVLQDCEVEADCLVGEEGQGFRYLMEFIDGGRLLLGALSLGGAQWCLDQAIERMKCRSTFGIRLSDRQGLRWRVAELQAKVTSLRATVQLAAARMDAGESARRETAIAKLIGPRTYSAAADLAIQCWGGEGFMADHALERHYRRARGMRIYMGTDEMQLNTIAKTVLGA